MANDMLYNNIQYTTNLLSLYQVQFTKFSGSSWFISFVRTLVSFLITVVFVFVSNFVSFSRSIQTNTSLKLKGKLTGWNLFSSA